MASEMWRFLDSGKENAFFHMALDEALLNKVSKGVSSPVFRLYEWEPDAVTLGYSQRIYDIIDVERCRRDGIDVTRRLTGGRAVYHHDEIAYTVIASTENPVLGGSVMETYRAVGKIFLEGFHRVDVPAVMDAGTKKCRDLVRHRRGLPCFLSTARYEITLHGSKLVGSAQLRRDGFFIQQGSIVFGAGHEKLADYVKDPCVADISSRTLGKNTIDLQRETRGTLSRDMLKKILFDTFRNAVAGTCEYSEPTAREYQETLRLRDNKYSSKGWIDTHG